jgi:hypothetical protein
MVAHVATRSASGRPFMTPLWFVADEETLFIATGAESWTSRNVSRHPGGGAVVQRRSVGANRSSPSSTRHRDLPPRSADVARASAHRREVLRLASGVARGAAQHPEVAPPHALLRADEGRARTPSSRPHDCRVRVAARHGPMSEVRGVAGASNAAGAIRPGAAGCGCETPAHPRTWRLSALPGSEALGLNHGNHQPRGLAAERLPARVVGREPNRRIPTQVGLVTRCAPGP